MSQTNFTKRGNLLFSHCGTGRLAMMGLAWRYGDTVTVLASAHRDGQIIARVLEGFGFSVVHGSTNKGGSNALRRLTKTLKNGGVIGITPDGPRGPRMRADRRRHNVGASGEGPNNSDDIRHITTPRAYVMGPLCSAVAFCTRGLYVGGSDFCSHQRRQNANGGQTPGIRTSDN